MEQCDGLAVRARLASRQLPIHGRPADGGRLSGRARNHAAGDCNKECSSSLEVGHLRFPRAWPTLRCLTLDAK